MLWTILWKLFSLSPEFLLSVSSQMLSILSFCWLYVRIGTDYCVIQLMEKCHSYFDGNWFLADILGDHLSKLACLLAAQN